MIYVFDPQSDEALSKEWQRKFYLWIIKQTVLNFGKLRKKTPKFNEQLSLVSTFSEMHKTDQLVNISRRKFPLICLFFKSWASFYRRRITVLASFYRLADACIDLCLMPLAESCILNSIIQSSVPYPFIIWPRTSPDWLECPPQRTSSSPFRSGRSRCACLVCVCVCVCVSARRCSLWPILSW
jgi:hypothetical protein